jgi:hypothetical protein
MRRSTIHARRVLLGLVCTASLGFGAVQAFASPPQAKSNDCRITGYAYILEDGCYECPNGGYCDGSSTSCTCFEW